MTDDPAFAAVEAVTAAALGSPANPARIRALTDYRRTELQALGRRRPSPAIDAMLHLLDGLLVVAERIELGDTARAELALLDAIAGVEVKT